MSADLLREAAAFARQEWQGETTGPFKGAARIHLTVADWLEAEATSLDAMSNFTDVVASIEHAVDIRGAALTVRKGENGEITLHADTSAPALAVARAYLDRSRPEGPGNPGVTGAQPDEPVTQAGRPASGGAS